MCQIWYSTKTQHISNSHLVSQAGLRTLQDLAPEMRLAIAMEDEEGLEGEMMEEEEFFRVRTPSI